MTEAELRDNAWIGDSILGLYARLWVLENVPEPTRQRTELFTLFTSNQFLACMGDPTKVEAEIGQLYHQRGLNAAFAHITRSLLPAFVAQVNNRQRGVRGKMYSAAKAPAFLPADIAAQQRE